MSLALRGLFCVVVVSTAPVLFFVPLAQPAPTGATPTETIAQSATLTHRTNEYKHSAGALNRAIPYPSPNPYGEPDSFAARTLSQLEGIRNKE